MSNVIHVYEHVSELFLLYRMRALYTIIYNYIKMFIRIQFKPYIFMHELDDS